MDSLFLGIVLCIIAFAGFIVKPKRYKVKRKSYTGHALLWMPFLLLCIGVFLIVCGLFGFHYFGEFKN